MHQTQDRSSTLEYLTVYPDGYVAGREYPVVFCLHGYGADMNDLSGLAPALDRTGYLYAFPNGPKTAFAGADYSARAWYERGGQESPEAVREALAALGPFVGEVLERFRVPAGRAVMLGFSQGGAMTLRYGLGRPETFAGLVVLSGSLWRVEDLVPELPAQRTQPLFIAHGTQDTVVPFEWGQRLVEFLIEQRYRPVFKPYRIGHQISPALVKDLRPWLNRVLPAKGATR